MAEPSMPTAHTSGSARCVRRRHQRVAPAPVTTPRKPVKQVMAPKMRLQGQMARGAGWGVARPGGAPPPRPPPGPTCPWPRRAGCCTSLPSSARPGPGAGTAGSTCPGPRWRRTRPTWPGRRRRSCGCGEARTAALSRGRPPRAAARGPRLQAGVGARGPSPSPPQGRAAQGALRPPSPPGSTHLRIRAFMSRSQEVRTLSCPPSWSAWPLLVAGTRIRMRVPVIMPTMGDTWEGEGRQVAPRARRAAGASPLGGPGGRGGRRAN